MKGIGDYMMNENEYILFKKIQEMIVKMNSNFILVDNGLALYSMIGDDKFKKEFLTIEKTYEYVYREYQNYILDLLSVQ